MVGCAVDGKDSRRGKRRKQPGLSGMGGNFATLRWPAARKTLHVLMIHHFGTHMNGEYINARLGTGGGKQERST